ncbi:hypothetical protein AAFF_G00265070 [Aldrovandia affinis]|uniref:LRRCT domain-containing protein n=1 Tax=Aldrovandia affinis TaxID=143900 RepID=A0AAD7W335_9TELE|nr:hypothetical protein AAFF_G00265070 [Aldrovandia affinis]
MASSWALRFAALLSGALALLAARAPTCPDRCDCQHAQHVLCANRGLRAVPEAPARAPTGDVLVFSLGGNFIGNISALDFGRYRRLTRLDLQYNRIRALHPRAFAKLSRLEELYLGNNLLAAISPRALHALGKLRILDANSNEISAIAPDSFASLESVIKLRLDGNAIETLQDAVFKGLANLLYLHLESNALRHVHGNAFATLEKLRFLNLSDNRQTSLSDARTFAPLASLSTLLLAGNRVQRVGNGVFQNLRRLRRLSLSNNSISALEPEALSGLSAVRQLSLDGNRLSAIPARLLDPLERAETLDFGRNRISRVDPAAFRRLAQLKVLKLNDNRLRSLAGEALGRSGALQRLDLSGNEWACDCALAGLQDWVRGAHARGWLLTVFVRCRHPPGLEGRYLDYLDSSQLQGAGNLTCAPRGSAAERPAGGAVGAVQAEPAQRSELPQQRHRPLVTDACHFNRLLLANVTSDRATPTSAVIRWGVGGGIVSGERLEIRVRYDRFGPAPSFPRFVYVGGGARRVTLRELEPGSAYLACVEGVVGGAACEVASREHCVGVVTLRRGRGQGRGQGGGGGTLQLVTAAMLAANALLLLLVGGAWAGRGLRRRLQSRKSAVHVRHMYSARRPLRAMATDAVCGDFTAYQTGRPPLRGGGEGDLIQFPCDRFLDNSGGNRRDDAMQRFQD